MAGDRRKHRDDDGGTGGGGRRPRPRPGAQGVLLALILIGLAALLGACARVGVADGPGREGGPSPAATLGIPPGHLPPPGRCRIWNPEVPPGQQRGGRRGGSCADLARRVPAGSWLVFRPTRDRSQVRVTVYGRGGPAVIRIFHAETGELIREEEP